MKTIDYINALIKEKDEYKELCKNHVENIYQLNRKIVNLKNDILRKDKKIKNLESEETLTVTQKNLEIANNELIQLREDYENLKNMYDEALLQKGEGNSVKSQKSSGKSELKKLKAEYNELKKKYDEIVREKEELMSIFDEVEQTVDINK